MIVFHVMEEKPILITAMKDKHTQAFFDYISEKYFPLHRNYLSTHITLFHKSKYLRVM